MGAILHESFIIATPLILFGSLWHYKGKCNEMLFAHESIYCMPILIVYSIESGIIGLLLIFDIEWKRK